MKAVQPRPGQRIRILAVVRDLLTDTKRTQALKTLGTIGARLLRLPRGALWQATLIVNNEKPNLTYTCVLPQSVGLPKDSKNKMVFAELEARIGGDHKIWLVADAKLV
jgi:hypothetical protein